MVSSNSSTPRALDTRSVVAVAPEINNGELVAVWLAALRKNREQPFPLIQSCVGERRA